MTPRPQAHIRITGSPSDRILAQRMANLNKADLVRIYRANLKRELKAGRASIRDILLDPPENVGTMKLFDLMLAMPKYGRVKVQRVLKLSQITPTKTIGEMSERQRIEIISRLKR